MDNDELIARLRKVGPLTCDPECHGRCKICPADVIRQAADALDVMKWIPVSERLPEASREILCWFQEQVAILRWKGRWCWHSGEPMTEYYSKELTHWMHLPAAPADGRDK